MPRTNIIRLGRLSPISEDLSAAIDCFLSYCESKNLSINTIIYYRNRLQAFLRFSNNSYPEIAPDKVTPQIVREFIACETKANSASTAAHSHTALKSFYSFLERDGFIDENPMHRVDKPKRKKTIINTLSLDQVQSVLSMCGKDFAGVRDRAIITLLIDSGLRVSELCGLTLDDINWSEHTMLVLGKGNKERIVPFGNVTRQVLMQYVGRRGKQDTDAVFVTVYGDPVNRRRVLRVIQQRCENAAITGVRCSPHTLRHSMAVAYLRNGGDVFSLQKLLGHSDLTMTRRYAELSQQDVQTKHRAYSPADRLNPAQNTGRKRLR